MRQIKTTSPESFRVRPSSGLLKALSTTDVSVYLQPQVRSVQHDKFLIMLMQVEADARLATLSERWRDPPKEPDKYFEHV